MYAKNCSMGYIDYLRSNILSKTMQQTHNQYEHIKAIFKKMWKKKRARMVQNPKFP